MGPIDSSVDASGFGGGGGISDCGLRTWHALGSASMAWKSCRRCSVHAS